MKVAIVDSGVSVGFLRGAGLSLAGAASFTVDREARRLESRVHSREELAAWRGGGAVLEDLEDAHGHGTAVLSILLEQGRRPGADVEWYVARVLDGRMRGDSLGLLEALEWLTRDVRPDLINLSLGTVGRAFEAPLTALLDRAVEQGSLVLCSAGPVSGLPSGLPSVVTVADTAMAHALRKGDIVDHVEASTTVRLYADGAWGERPITSSYACALAAARVLREGCPAGWRRVTASQRTR
ncbi:MULTISPECIES: S8/S53 family peptidase [unclassified Corallococcus]|uniref:S8/S53 family peptidase n=1 Tax=unclassified Corallococcus TaxID=2685029 RepID=UPI001A8FD3C4|nr:MULTISPECIES: S8/S53 family peptidase [unclassified Corallococcus]MBN9688149.1 S8/S53 family peptidase [Corallococcus sp. NCSPR001]WAS88044.1 S8/S53 family peptidase [Corallococcus sp. NCRR]